jgi:osmoprotectant transport system ATP-binding protein
LKVREGQICCLVGSSGSGKTTTLRLINGLLKPQSGKVFLNGNELDFSQAEQVRRTMGYSIQGSGLFPHMTLFENLTIIARKKGWDKARLEQRVNELCELMFLPHTKAFLSKKPREISGGQQQRVGIARALFLRPKIMLMDEPFSALDPITRNELQNEFVRLQRKLNITIVLVTHDLSEAFAMADEIVLLNQGKLEQKGRPSRFLLAPATPYVVDFMQSHSPGSRLKEVFLYSVINTDLFVSLRVGQQIQVQNLETGEKSVFSDPSLAVNFLESRGQRAHYWVKETREYIGFETFDGHHATNKLNSSQNILQGMKNLLDFSYKSLPVVNDQNQVVGVFSAEALDAL